MMNKWLKFGLITIVAVLVTLVALLASIIFLVNPNDFKDELMTQVEKNIHRELRIEGDLSWQLWPPLGIQIGRSQLNNTAQFEQTPFIKFESAVVSVDVLPLLSGNLLVNQLSLNDLYVHVIRNEQGISNIDDLISSGSSNQDVATSDKSTEKKTSSFSIHSMQFKQGIGLNHAVFKYDDLQAGTQQTIEDVNVRLGGFSFNEWFSVESSLNLALKNPDLQAKFALQSQLLIKPQFSGVNIRDLSLKVSASGGALPPSSTTLDLKMAAEIDLVKQQFDLSEWQLNSEQTSSKQFALDNQFNLSFQAQGNWADGHFNLKDVKFTQHTKGATAKPLEWLMQTHVTIDMPTEEINLTPLSLQLGDVHASAPVKITHFLSNPLLQTELNVAPFNLRNLLSELGMTLDLSSKQALEKLSLAAKIQFQGQQLKIDDFNMMLDESHVNGFVHTQLGDKIATQFKMRIDQINMDNYLAPVPQEPLEKSTTDEKPAESSAPPDLSLLKSFDSQGDIQIGTLTVKGVKTKNNLAHIRIKKGILAINPFKSELYGGSVEGGVNLNVNGAQPTLAIHNQISTVLIEPLLQDLAQKDLISGQLTGEMHLNSTGLDPVLIQQTLTGKGQFSFKDGAVKGINIAAMIRQAKSAVSGQSKEAVSEPLKTDFTALTGGFEIINGVINNPDLNAQSPLLRVQGQGKVDLPKKGIHYALSVSAVDSLKGQDGKSVNELNKLTIPLLIKGDLLSPTIKLDYKAALDGQLKEKTDAELAKIKEQAKQKEDELKQKTEDKLKEKLDSTLKDKIKLF